MECFGDSDDDDDDTEEAGTDLTIQRDLSCGVCCFHSNTEASLLTHVRNSLAAISSSAAAASLTSASSTVGESDDKYKLRRPHEVLHAIDEFCTSRHWMMHIGPEKGGILVSALKDALDRKIQCAPTITAAADLQIHPVFSFVAVELGTYCAYASILLGNAIYETMQQQPNSDVTTMECHLFTTEINQEYIKIATEMIVLSGMEDVISLHEICYNGQYTNVVETVADAIIFKHHRTTRTAINADEEQSPPPPPPPPMIDFLFIDHDKDAYNSDLCKLEASGMIRCGTRVVADNVVFACIDDYVQYVQHRMELGIVNTRTICSRVEYSGSDSALQDGVGK